MTTPAFLILFLILLALITLVPMCGRRLNIPDVISLLIVGMVIGPHGIDLIGWLAPRLAIFGGSYTAVGHNAQALIDSLGSLGLLLLMTLAGMEADFRLIRTSRKPVICLSFLTFTLPAVTGFLVYRAFRADDLPGQVLYASLFASHSVGIVFPIIRELKLSRSIFGVTILITTVITDILSILLLAVSVNMKRTASSNLASLSLFDYVDPSVLGNWFIPVFLLVIALYFAIVLFFTPRLGRFILRVLPNGADAVITSLLFVILAAVMLGELLGINHIVGAFLAGLGLSKIVKVKQGQSDVSLFKKFEGIGYGLLIPFLFLSIGMKSDFTLLFSDWGNIWVIVFTVLGLVASKVLSGWIGLRVCGFSNAEALCAGVMTVPQLSATLAAAAIGKELGLLDENFFNAIVILSIITTLPVPNIARAIIVHNKLTFPTISFSLFHVPEDERDDELL